MASVKITFCYDWIVSLNSINICIAQYYLIDKYQDILISFRIFSAFMFVSFIVILVILIIQIAFATILNFGFP